MILAWGKLYHLKMILGLNYADWTAKQKVRYNSDDEVEKQEVGNWRKIIESRMKQWQICCDQKVILAIDSPRNSKIWFIKPFGIFQFFIRGWPII